MNTRIKSYILLRNQKGFTLLEAIVAIMVLSLAISGVFSSVRQGLSQSIIAKEDVRAFYLAQEAVEVVRHIRNNNQIDRLRNGSNYDNAWLQGIAHDPTDPCFLRTCAAEVLGDSAIEMELIPCFEAGGGCPPLREHPTTRFLNYGSGAETTFVRSIEVNPVWENPTDVGSDGLPDNNIDEVEVVVRVTWQKGTITREFTAKTLLFDWVDAP